MLQHYDNELIKTKTTKAANNIAPTSKIIVNDSELLMNII